MMSDEFSVQDWAVFEHPATGEPISPSGSPVPGASAQQDRHARVTFFGESGRKINRKLEELQDVESQISYLLFVRHDPTEQLRHADSEEAEGFIDSVDQRLRAAYQTKLEQLRDEIEDLPGEDAIDRLQDVKADEQQRQRSDASPEVNRFINLLDAEMSRPAYRENDGDGSGGKGGRSPLSEEDKFNAFSCAIEVFENNGWSGISNFLDDVGERIAKKLDDNIKSRAVRDRVEQALDHVRDKFDDLDLPDGTDTNEWKAKRSDLLEAESRWGPSSD